MILVEEFVKFLKQIEKEHKALLGEEYRKEFFFKEDMIGFYFASIPKDELEMFLYRISKGEQIET